MLDFPRSRVAWLWLVPAVVALIATAGRAHDDHPHKPKKVADAALYRPSAMPDRIILTWVDDPATTQAVTWRTSTDVVDAWAEIAEADAGPGFVKAARKTRASTQHLKSNLNEAHYHTARFSGLKPSTRYAYRVGDGANFSEWFQFSTASIRPEPFSFIYFGDAQNEVRSMWSRVAREAYRDAPRARFMIHAGDLINSAESDAEWGEWFAAGHWLNAMVPSVPVLGNHEMAKGKEKDAPRRVSHHWRPQFALPENGPNGLEETCFTLVYQNLRIVGLNSNEQLPQQAEWLDRVLAANESPWVVCTFHHPIYSTSQQRDNSALRSAWKPVFDKYKVDLVLQGHDHSYGRTGLHPSLVTSENVGTGVNQLDPETGTVYVVSVSGPKMYNLKSQAVMKRAGENTQLYQIIHIDGESLRYEARTAVGEVYDAFTLRKRPGAVNELIEQVPPTPERRKPPEPPRPAADSKKPVTAKATAVGK
ncbi:MAG TPA: metallophosphoesterase family protein [Planctomycetaceae bacterium]|nr:metallophosphoesterase family protein [Planctomycetaceae bacterium]